MSHPDPLFDPENAYEDDMNYDDYNDFFDEDSSNYHPDADHEISTHVDDDENEEEDVWNDDVDDSMDGDFDSAMRDAGFGTDEDYGYYGEDY
jgi:hypothetical protein